MTDESVEQLDAPPVDVAPLVLPDPPADTTYEVVDHDAMIVKVTGPDGVAYRRGPELPGWNDEQQGF